jgi:hypothetical protein
MYSLWIDIIVLTTNDTIEGKTILEHKICSKCRDQDNAYGAR